MKNRRSIKDAVVRQYPVSSREHNLRDAIRLMAENNASALMVGDDIQSFGLITITDVMHCLATETDLEKSSVGSFMTQCDIISTEETRNPCVQLDEDQDVISAVKVMVAAGVNHLMVTGRDGEPVGIVSSLELIKLFNLYQ